VSGLGKGPAGSVHRRDGYSVERAGDLARGP
jgi:hypothetical protein